MSSLCPAVVPAHVKHNHIICGHADDLTLFLGNLTWSITEDDIRDAFSSVGEPVSIRIAEDREGRRRGFAFAEFASMDEVQRALELDGADVLGRQIRVDRSTRSSAGRALPLAACLPSWPWPSAQWL